MTPTPSSAAAPHATDSAARGDDPPRRSANPPVDLAIEIVQDAAAFAGAMLPEFTCHPSYNDAVTARTDKGVLVGKPLQPTSAFWEGLVLSFRNALVFDRSDVSRRMYGCLYGIQVKGEQDYPFIPALATFLSTVQSFLSALFLFLAGLGLRNMYRVR